MKAFQGVTPEWWTPTTEKSNPKPTRFKLRPLNGIEQFEIVDLCIQIDGGGLKIPKAAAERAVTLAVMEAENLEGYDPNRPILEQLPTWECVRELAIKIINAAILGPDEKKSYGSPQPSPGTPSNSGAQPVATDTGVSPVSAIRNGPEASARPLTVNG